MTDMAFQEVFNRVYLYLITSGADMTSDQFRVLLQLIDDSITKASREGGAETVLDIAMDLVPVRFTLPQEVNRGVGPPLMRGSIGYRSLSSPPQQ